MFDLEKFTAAFSAINPLQLFFGGLSLLFLVLMTYAFYTGNPATLHIHKVKARQIIPGGHCHIRRRIFRWKTRGA